MSYQAERRLDRIRQHVEESLAVLPESDDDENTFDPEGEIVDTAREILNEVKGLLTGSLGRTFAEIHITGKGFRSVGVYRHFFRDALRRVRAHRATYEQERREWYEEGDGRAPNWQEESDEGGHTWRWNAGGRGQSFPHCVHGTSLWTDYDNICGGCEEGLSAVEEARGLAREAYLRFNDRWDWMSAAPGDLDETTRRKLVDWTCSLLPKS